MDTEVNQTCICSLGLAPECPAHPFRKKREAKAKVSRQALKDGECAACVFIREASHELGRHPLNVGDIKTALEIGPVFCRIPKITDQPLLVRGCAKTLGVPHVEVLEGQFAGVKEIWMKAPAKKSKRVA